MEKVIVVSAHTNILNNNPFVETEYPVLNKYLSEGYAVKEVVPIIKPSDASYMYALVFILTPVK